MVPRTEWYCEFVLYYDTLFSIITTKNWNTALIAYARGVFQGCVASSRLFLLAYQIVLDFLAQFGTEPYSIKSDLKSDSNEAEETVLLQQA